MIKFSLVDVSSIQSNVPRSKFSEDEIEQLADMILECEGVLNVILLTQIGINQYSVLEGDLEYYAAVRAKEKNLRQGEIINAIIVPNNNQESFLKQAEVFKNLSSSKIVVSNESLLESRVQNIELRFERQLNELAELQRQQQQAIEARFKAFEQYIKPPSNPLDILNNCEKLEELTLKLERAKIKNSEKLSKAIFEARQKKQQSKFNDYQDVFISVKALLKEKNVKGLLGDKTMLAIIDALS